jgi:hypothetical protein
MYSAWSIKIEEHNGCLEESFLLPMLTQVLKYQQVNAFLTFKVLIMVCGVQHS